MKKSTLLCFAVPFVLLGSCKFLVKQLVDYTEYWPNGLPKSQGKLLGKKQSGEWTLTYDDGRRRAKGSYNEDRQFGEWTFYYPNGNEEYTGSYDENGLRTGEWLFSYDDGTPQANGRYDKDFEDGLWTRFGPDGRVIDRGQFEATERSGKRSGLWRLYYDGGKPRAEGVYHRGKPVGPWQVWDERGVRGVRDYPQMAGVQVVRKVWSGTDTVQRVGVLVNGQPAGRWTSFHPNGKLRFVCGIAGGVPTGSFEARDEAGAVIAQGRFEGGAIASGVVVADGKSREIEVGALPSPPAGVDAWSAMASVGAAKPEGVVSMFVNEQKSKVGPAPFAALALAAEAPGEGTPAKAEEVLSKIESEDRRMPAPAQPGLSKDNRDNLEKFKKIYTDGEKPGVTMGDDYAPTPGAPRPKSGTGLRENLMGKPMPFKIMQGVDGKDVDLTAYHGKQRVMIVVLRGFLGEVCMYCMAQTGALADARPKLEAANVEVLVIYPGERENEKSFRRLYEEVFGEGPPPYRVFYDPDSELVTKLGIKGDLASPTTLIIDEKGTVQYAYVGEHRADRPATNALIKLIEGM